ncbi:protease inhibitor I42 family protein [Bradyrhizobium sp. ma5]|uniref:protease inhibitor I42 family protein n=1 Tax=Bradyrhizobium sp. ma5 TaxID=3344828 RepID=UPI0035D3E924
MARAHTHHHGLFVFAVLACFAGALGAQETGSSASAALALDEAPSKPLELRSGRSLFVSLARSGGTGFFWDATTKRPDIATVAYVTSKRSAPAPRTVGAPERDIFEMQAHAPGETSILFALKRANGEPINRIDVPVHVLGN